MQERNGKEIYKKVRCTCKVVVMPTSIVVFDVLIAVALSPHIQEARASAEKRDVLTFLVTRRVYCASSNIRVCCN